MPAVQKYMKSESTILVSYSTQVKVSQLTIIILWDYRCSLYVSTLAINPAINHDCLRDYCCDLSVTTLAISCNQSWLFMRLLLWPVRLFQTISCPWMLLLWPIAMAKSCPWKLSCILSMEQLGSILPMNILAVSWPWTLSLTISCLWIT